MSLQPGDILLGKYRVEALIGEGSFGEVYKVIHPTLKPRAIKVLRRDMPGVGSVDIRNARERFAMEARLGDQLNHPNVIKVLEFEDEQDELYLVMEYAPGGSLKDRLQHGPLTVEDTVRLGVDVCAGLQAIHEKLHAVHRDIKPSNLLFAEDGTACICDLGLAQVGSEERSKLGSLSLNHPGDLRYKSPEQASATDYLQPTSDIFSLGCVLFEALTCKLYKDFYSARVREYRADVPRWLDEIVTRALEEQPGRVPADDSDKKKRYRQARLMQNALEQGWQKEVEQREAVRLAEQKAAQRAIREREAQELTRKIAAEKAVREKQALEAANKAAQERTQQEAQRKIYQQHEDRESLLRRKAFSNKVRLYTLIFIFSLITLEGVVYFVRFIPKLVPKPTLGFGSTMISVKDGMTMVYVPTGNFLMGSTDSDPNAKPEEKPQHTVYLDTFWIDQTDVTNAMYAKCVNAGACKQPANLSSQTHSSYYGNSEFNNYPVIYVDWNMADTYCRWAGRQLPTEAQWEKAARGTDGRTNPWGNNAPDNILLNYNSYVGDTTAVGNYPKGASPYGVLDMAGEVWQWVADWYSDTYYQSSPASNPLGPDSGQYRVLRGGAWLDDYLVRSAFRNWNDPTYAGDYFGFRCSRSLP